MKFEVNYLNHLDRESLAMIRLVNEPNEHEHCVFAFVCLTETEHERKHEHVIGQDFRIHVFSLRKRKCSFSFIFIH